METLFLRKIVRQIISEALALDEAAVDIHVTKRLKQRIMLPKEHYVGFYSPEFGRHIEVGTYQLKPEDKTLISKRIEIASRVDFPEGKEVGIKLLDLDIKPEEVTFFSNGLKEQAKGQTLVIVDNTEGRPSIGDQVWIATDRNNTLMTLMLRSSFQAPSTRWDITINDFKEVMRRDDGISS